jgi:alpha-beta hydrolase superfamily lysophospholipase
LTFDNCSFNFATLKKKIIFRWIKVLLVIYCVVGIALYYLQDKLMFHPEPVDKNANYSFNIPYKEVNIPFTESININIIQFTTTGKPKGVVLYFHGNRKNISHYARFAPEFTRNGYEVWMLDYPGYGKSTGELTEQRLYDWALLMYTLSRKAYSRDSIIIYGKSMGTGIAAQLASVRDTRRLILETPYYSFPSIVGQYAPIYPLRQMVHFKIPTYEYLQKVTAPITIFHGTSDGVIRHRNASKLKKFLKQGDEFISIEGGSHNDLHEFKLFQQKLDSLLNL